MNALAGAVRVTHIHLCHPPAFPSLDDLDMGQRARDTEPPLRQATAVALAGRTIGLAENLGKQTGIAGITIGHQDQVMAVR